MIAKSFRWMALVLCLFCALPEVSAKLAMQAARRRAELQRQKRIQQARKAKQKRAEAEAKAPTNPAPQIPPNTFGNPAPGAAEPFVAPPAPSQNPGGIIGGASTPPTPPVRPRVNPPVKRARRLAPPPPRAPLTNTVQTNLHAVIESHWDKRDQLLESQKENAAKGNPDALYVMGMRYHLGIGVPKDRQYAHEYLQKSAALGNQKAKKQLEQLD
jgi:hypothetical protein